MRKIRGGRRGNRGRLSANKAGGRAEFESTLERDFFMLLEFDEAVETFMPQPVRIAYRAESGRATHYVPDALVTYRDGRAPSLYEVKYQAELQARAAEFRLKFQAAASYAAEQGWTFAAITEHDIRTARLKNVAFLRAFLDPQRVFSEGTQVDLLARLRAQPGREATPASLLAGLSVEQRGAALPVLWHLIARHRIGAELEQPLGMNSRLISKAPS
ncbi:TnsA endonuclease N-terminal domain-containing protein [Deinococcus sp.]|uniref:TnsA endonuclease N-terminal domain-containing protein n=1 Tax=Deinococcus sp. TaxID=47478 RepID=UPI0025F1C632|nr:TnsA endonuclease N-terminal domain-containing protein [Deinococcus sp.]